jgi:ubiquinone/menaquinone biosynthesis C-methylase UbiE
MFNTGNSRKMTQTGDYVLGTHDAEIARLGLQHQVWRAHMLETWTRAGMTRGSRVIDFGAGPGFATLDASEIVGAQGQVVALERSPHFLRFAKREIEHRRAENIQLIESDLMTDDVELSEFDVAWCRWVASFVSNPRKLVDMMCASLRVGGRVVFHEYQSYATWRVIPTNDIIDNFVQEVMASWRGSGGEPDIAPSLISLMTEIGLQRVQVRPLIFAVRPSEFMWQWPAAFVTNSSQRLVELGMVRQEWAVSVRSEFEALSANPHAILVTPMVMEIIAEKIR